MTPAEASTYVYTRLLVRGYHTSAWPLELRPMPLCDLDDTEMSFTMTDFYFHPRNRAPVYRVAMNPPSTLEHDCLNLLVESLARELDRLENRQR